jgi:hypothetical protein
VVVHERQQSSADGQNHAHDRQQLRRVHYLSAAKEGGGCIFNHCSQGTCHETFPPPVV